MNKNNLAKEMFSEMEVKMTTYREEIAEKYGNDAEALKEALVTSVYEKEYYKNAYNNALARGNRIDEVHAALVKENKELDAENFRLQRFENAYHEERRENIHLRKALDAVLHKSSEALEESVEESVMVDIRETALTAIIGEKHE